MRSRVSRSPSSMRRAMFFAFHEVVQEFGDGRDTRNKEMITRARTGDIEQVALGVVDLLQIRIVADRLDALLQGHDLVIAGHDGDSTEFQSLRQMHGADGDVTAGRLHIIIQDLEWYSRLLCRSLRAVQLIHRANKQAE